MSWDQNWSMSNGWSQNQNIVYTSGMTATNLTGSQFVVTGVPITPPPPQTEVERLFAEVEEICALAR